jgi:hypothetical protein
MPEPGQPAPDAVETIAIVYSIPEACVLVATLRAYGILALPRNQGHISVLPRLMLALGGIRITIPAGQVEDAIALMEEIDTGWRCPPPPLGEPAWLGAIVSVILTMMFGAPPMPRASGLYRWRSATAPRSGA